MRFLLLLCFFFFFIQSCTLPTSSNTNLNTHPSLPPNPPVSPNPPSGSGGAFILTEANLNRTIWGYYDSANITYLLGFYSSRNGFLGVYCEAWTASKEEAIRIMEKSAREDPKNYVFPAHIRGDYVEIVGPGLNFRLRPLNQREAAYSVMINGHVSSTHSMERFR